jgi:hypothetical protein
MQLSATPFDSTYITDTSLEITSLELGSLKSAITSLDAHVLMTVDTLPPLSPKDELILQWLT